MANELCHEHSGFCAKIETLEGNVSALWVKVNSMYTILIGALITAVLNLIGVVIILLR